MYVTGLGLACSRGQNLTEIGLIGISAKGKPRKSEIAPRYITVHWHTDIVSFCNSKWHPL